MAGTSNTRQGETGGSVSVSGSKNVGGFDVSVNVEVPLPGGKTGANPTPGNPANGPPAAAAGIGMGTLLAIAGAIFAFKK